MTAISGTLERPTGRAARSLGCRARGGRTVAGRSGGPEPSATRAKEEEQAAPIVVVVVVVVVDDGTAGVSSTTISSCKPA